MRIPSLNLTTILSRARRYATGRPVPLHVDRRPTDRCRWSVAEILEERTLLSAVAPPSGLVSWWTADNTPNDLKGGNNATLSNGATYAAGEVAEAFKFDGSNDRATVSDANNLKFTQSMTIEAWIKIQAYPPGPPFDHAEILFRGDDRGGLDPYSLSVEPDGTVNFHIESLTEIQNLSTPVPLGSFVHVAATLDDATGLMRIYINGMLSAQVETTVRPFRDLDPTSSPSIGIGNHSGGPSSSHNFPFNGLIDELTVYDRALTPAEIQRIYSAGSDGKIKNSNYFASDFPTATEGSGSVMTFTITRAGDLSGTAAVNWQTSNGTAIAGTDYVAASGVLTFANHESQKTVQITLLNDSTSESNKTFNLLLTTTTPGYAAANGEGTIVDDDHAASHPFSRVASLEGLYFVGNEFTKVLRAGGQLTFVNRAGGTSAGFVQDATHLIATDWQQPALFDATAGTITFANNSVWTKVPELSGWWLNSGGQTLRVNRIGTEVTFTNALGQTSAGAVLSATTVLASEWNVTGTVTANGARIVWSNGRVWDFIPDVSAPMTNGSGDPVQVVQAGASLIFVNRLGQTSTGRFIDFSHVEATDWGSNIGTLVGNSIVWSNGIAWTTQSQSGTNPHIGGLWDDDGSDSRIIQADGALTLIDGTGDFSGPSTGHFASATQIVADDWGVTATLSGNELTFSNGDVWTLLPSIAGVYFDGAGRLARVEQLERTLKLTTGTGNMPTAIIVGTTQVHEINGPGRDGTISAGALTWNTGEVWSMLPDLRGTWQSILPPNRPTFIEQNGLDLILIDLTGVRYQAELTTSTTISIGAILPGAPTMADVIDDRTLEFDNSWNRWQRPPASVFDKLFADPTAWPFV